jgi:hypothetical protein
MERELIIQYIRHPRTNARIGVLVAKSEDLGEGKTRINFGWSMCYKKDEFDRERGLKIALGRAAKGTCIAGSHSHVQRDFPKFFRRSLKYFKAEIPEEQIEGLITEFLTLD